MTHMNVKILFHIGQRVGAKTIMERGYCIEEAQCLYIKAKDEREIALDCLERVELYKHAGLATMVKLVNGSDTIFLTVPRIYIRIGTGFAIVNYLATVKVKDALDAAMRKQKKSQ